MIRQSILFWWMIAYYYYTGFHKINCFMMLLQTVKVCFHFLFTESWSNEPGDIERYFYNVRDNILQTRSKDCLKMGVYH